MTKYLEINKKKLLQQQQQEKNRIKATDEGKAREERKQSALNFE